MIGGLIIIGLDNSSGFLGVGITGKGPVFSDFPSPIEEIGPPIKGDGKGAGLGTPGVVGISGVIFLGISIPDGFFPDFIL